jgi:integrase
MPRTRSPLAKIRIHVYLRRPDKEGFYTTRMVAYFHNTSFSVFPGVKVLPQQATRTGRMEELWNAGAGRVSGKHPSVDGRSATELNGTLQHWQEKIEAAFWKLAGPHGQQQVTARMMEEEIYPAEATSPAADPRKLTFRQHYELWVQENTGLYKAATLRQQNSVPDELERYKPGCVAGDLNEKFVRNYVKHLLAGQFADGTIINHFKLIRMIAARLGYTLREPWLKYSGSNAPQLDLEADELRRLILVKLPELRLQQERDRWLLQCFSGRRDGDLRQISRRQLETLQTDNGTITLLRHSQEKTLQVALAPLPPVAVAIGERYDWQLPSLSNQQRNEAIKEVAKLAGLTRQFNDMHISGGTITDNYRPVHEIIGTHTARHTCGSLILEGGGGDRSLSGFVLGHGTKTATDIYAKDKLRRVAPKILAAWKAVLGDLYEG